MGLFLLNKLNIVISGHPSSGTTSTALILAYALQKKFVYAGGTLKFMAQKLGYDSKGDEMTEFEKKYGEKWDIIWENYIKWKIENDTNLLVNSKIASFFTEKRETLFEAFITADIETRMERAGVDARTEDIRKREEEIATRWFRLFEVELLNEDAIRNNHDILIDNSEITIAETAYEIFSKMRKAIPFKEQFLLSDFEKLELILNEKGKKFFYDKLDEKNLLIPTEQILREWVDHFEHILEKCEPEWQEVVRENAD